MKTTLFDLGPVLQKYRVLVLGFLFTCNLSVLKHVFGLFDDKRT